MTQGGDPENQDITLAKAGEETRGEALEGGVCLLAARPDPVTVVIFGASGDLTGRKLVPALYNLHKNGELHPNFLVVGAARSDLDDQEFRDRMRGAVAAHDPSLAAWQSFSERLFYQPVVYDEKPSYRALADRLRALEGELGLPGNRIFNLAIPPSLYKTVALKLADAWLSYENTGDRGWTRLVVEKPFGSDLESSRELNRALNTGFKEHQVFRIDHYMAKETVQNIMLLRFANAIFEPIWNRNFIRYVNIVAAESLGVGHRAGYYEKAGVLRDMFQNHMMQLLALVAAEPPSLFEADRVRDEKVKLFRSLRPFPTDRLYDNLVLGQYAAGQVDGRPVPGYRQEEGIAPDSLIPTFAGLRVFVDNWRWQGVPFYLASGKRLAAKNTRIDIQFKEVPHSLFRKVLGEHISANRLSLGIYPNEEINLTFQTKRPGARLCLRSVRMEFDYSAEGGEPRREAYEKALLDAMLGDQTLFWRQDGLELTWAFLDPVLYGCETCKNRAGNLHPYPAGSAGPAEALGVLPEPLFR